MATQKRYLYKVYTSAGAYITTWNDVVSDFNNDEEVNAAGSEVVVRLARKADNFGELSDIAFDNKVVIVCINSDNPNGFNKFQGRIEDYENVYGDQEYVEVTLIGYGSELAEYMLDMGDSLSQGNQDSYTVFGQAGASRYLAQSFTPASTIRISSLTLFMKTTADGGPSSAWSTQVSFVQGTPGVPFSGTSIGGATMTVNMVDPGEVKFTFDTPITLTGGLPYYFELSGGSNGSSYANELVGFNSNPLAFTGGTMYTFTNGVDTVYQSTNVPGDIYFKLNAATTVTFNSQDPSNMLKRVLDIYATAGGNITYDGSSIDLTGTVASYTFVTTNVLDAVKKILELAPVDWYWYIDQATNKLHFHNKSTATIHKLVIGKDFQSVGFKKRKENLVNVIYFTGGEVSPGVNFYKKYVESTSKALYKTKALPYSDNRVTVTGTADLIANGILATRSFPTIQASLEITDNYNLELIKPGDVIQFRGFKDNGNGGLWDIAVWDADYWDYDLTNPQSYSMQVVKFRYTPDSISAVLSTVPPDVNKRIEDINRNLQALQTIANPVSPS